MLEEEIFRFFFSPILCAFLSFASFFNLLVVLILNMYPDNGTCGLLFVLRSLLDNRCKTMREELHRVEETQKDVKFRKRQSFPTWVLVLLIPIFGVVMALPLLQL